MIVQKTIFGSVELIASDNLYVPQDVFTVSWTIRPVNPDEYYWGDPGEENNFIFGVRAASNTLKITQFLINKSAMPIWHNQLLPALKRSSGSATIRVIPQNFSGSLIEHWQNGQVVGTEEHNPTETFYYGNYQPIVQEYKCDFKSNSTLDIHEGPKHFRCHQANYPKSPSKGLSEAERHFDTLRKQFKSSSELSADIQTILDWLGPNKQQLFRDHPELREKYEDT